MTPPVRISVVIPALDEEKTIERSLRSVLGRADQVVVVDGGSADETAAVVRGFGAELLTAPSGRGVQLDHGARAASGDVLVFLHADTALDPGWAEELRALPERFAGGAFRFAVDSPRTGFRFVEQGVRLRCALFRLPYGDQAIFARREAFLACGGFGGLPLMEDVAFVRRLRRVGPLAFLRARAVTSARRWERGGIARTTLGNLRRLALYHLGRSPERLARGYDDRHDP